MYKGLVNSDKRINLLFVELAKFTEGMAKRYDFEGCKYGLVHSCIHTCSDCMLIPPCISAGPRIPCDLCNRHFRTRT